MGLILLTPSTYPPPPPHRSTSPCEQVPFRTCAFVYARPYKYNRHVLLHDPFPNDMKRDQTYNTTRKRNGMENSFPRVTVVISLLPSPHPPKKKKKKKKKKLVYPSAKKIAKGTYDGVCDKFSSQHPKYITHGVCKVKCIFRISG
ncbi:hypothetical protein POVWA2_027060 [Plasmodium ovale wallikeri]|uniref:Uncharacterized protein n=1 Tax=Plasmodium ovale wallikeri TaxID=864142 RepID=A0A1A8YVX8_PLAOA|nr:hypothetical protein POVWA1_029050 [Plasmodium ovale wallikeri]SBT35842.1 hypothetical protein POVWA2_027060 [Plasmodium ovale wallikeri]